MCSGGIWNVASSSPPRSSRVHCLNLSFISCTSTPKSSLASRYKCPRTNYPCFIYSISSSLFPVWLPHVYTRLKTTPPSVRTVGSTRHRSIGFHSSFLFKSIRDPRSTTRIDIEETIQRGRGERPSPSELEVDPAISSSLIEIRSRAAISGAVRPRA